VLATLYLRELIDPGVGVFLRLRYVNIAPVQLEHRVRRDPLDGVLVVGHDRPIFRGFEPLLLTSRAGFDDVIKICRVGSYEEVVCALKSN